MKTKLLMLLALLICLSSICDAQSRRQKKAMKKAKKGKYEEANSVREHPYTIFNKSKPGFNLQTEIDAIKAHARDNIAPFAGVYDQIVQSGNTQPGPGGYPDASMSPAASAAKNAAFVYLMGFDENGMDITMNPGLHQGYRDRAVAMLKAINTEVKNYSFDDWEYVGASQCQWRNKELLLYAQAYDMLMTAKERRNFPMSDDDITDMKNRLQIFARNVFRKSNNILAAFGKRNNHSLIAAGGLGTAAIVLNDCGFRRGQKAWYPKTWAHAAHWNTQKTMFGSDNGMSSGVYHSGYAEGPHYFLFAFESELPFFRSFANFVPQDVTRSYDYSLWKSSQSVRNYFFDPTYDHLFQWFVDLYQPNGLMPSYDNTFGYEKFPYMMAIPGKQEFMPLAPANTSSLDVLADFLATGITAQTPSKDPNMYSPLSGDLILRTPYSTAMAESHYIHVSGEQGTALNGGGHEHADASSFIITAGDEVLALDPAYIGWSKSRKFIDNGDDHNVILVDKRFLGISGVDVGPKEKTESSIKPLVQVPDKISSEVHTSYKSTYFERKVEMMRQQDIFYYVLTDYVDRKGTNPQREFTFNLNGNGNFFEGTCTSLQGGAMVRWTHPCSVRNNTWNLQAFVGVKGGGATYDLRTMDQEDDRGTVHGNFNFGTTPFITNMKSPTDNMKYDWGVHTQMQVTKEANKTTFLSVLWPYKCGTTPPDMTKTEDNDKVSITIEDIGPDSVTNVHEARMSAMIIDHFNPLNWPLTAATMRYDADYVHLSMSKKNHKFFRNCLAETNFRMASFDRGKFLTYDNDSLIQSPEIVDASYQLYGRFKYRGVVNVPEGTGATEITFYLPDLKPGYPMTAVLLNEDQELTNVYIDSLRKIKITFDEGITEFEIKLEDPCLMSCFFPPTYITIDTLFDFNTGTTEYLGHDLPIIMPEGHLRITEGSKMSICPDFTLSNIDSITMEGLFRKGDEELPVHTRYGEDGQPIITMGEKKVHDRLASLKSMIIINNRAAVVLNPGSYTHVGANSTILVKKGGTLVIRNGAVLEIGSKNHPGWGEVIAEDGAYVCVEPAADIRFFANPQDSTDKNIFFVSMLPLPEGTHPGVNTAGALGKFIPPLGIYSSTHCLPFCHIKYLNTFNSIYNKPFGWANINFPEASMELKDTFCANESVIANGIRTLNESKYHFRVCEYNPTLNACTSPVMNIPMTIPMGIWDSIRITSKNLSLSYPFLLGKNYRVQLIAKNDCDEKDTAEKIIYVGPAPNASFSIPSYACPGIGTLIADGSMSTHASRHMWSVSRIDNVNLPETDDTYEPQEEYYEMTGTPGSFHFPDFRFYGGHAYEITLTVYNVCGSSEYTRTILIPLSAKIQTPTHTFYATTPLYTAMVTLTGMMQGQSSFLWTSSNSLSNNVNPVITDVIGNTTEYILTVNDGMGCTNADTLTIKINQYANAGNDYVICRGDSVQLGLFVNPLPPGHTYFWTPSAGLSNCLILQPFAKPDTNSVYTLQIKDMMGNVIETDEVTIEVDSPAIPAFTVQWEDTFEFCFSNQTEPAFATNTYSWNFGDGSSASSDINPCHIFPNYGVDTFFVICLTATNNCGDSTWCDTLWIDSAGSVQTLAPTSLSEANGSISKSKLLRCIPNPVFSKASIEYIISPDAKNAQLWLSSSSGVLLEKHSLNRKGHFYTLDCSGLARGFYYYSLIVDGKVVHSQKMSIH